MKITDVVVRKVEKEDSRIKGIASVMLDNCFAVHDIKIIEGKHHPLVKVATRLLTHKDAGSE